VLPIPMTMPVNRSVGSSSLHQGNREYVCGSGDDVSRIQSHEGSNIEVVARLLRTIRVSTVAGHVLLLHWCIISYLLHDLIHNPASDICLSCIFQLVRLLETTSSIHTLYRSVIMYGLSALAVLATIASTAVAALNDTSEYRLKSVLKPGQRNKRLFENLVGATVIPTHVLELIR
jgi:hypothetical protein